VALAATAVLLGRVLAVAVLGVEVPPGERVEEDPGPDADSQVDGVVSPAREQPDRLEHVERVVEARERRPSLAAHVGGRDHRARDVAREEEEEGDVAHGEVHPGPQELLGQRQLRGAAQHAPAGEHHQRRDGRPRPLLRQDRPQDVRRLHRDEDLHARAHDVSGGCQCQRPSELVWSHVALSSCSAAWEPGTMEKLARCRILSRNRCMDTLNATILIGGKRRI